MTAFHAAVDNAWVLRSWDRMMIPKPFSRVLVRVSKLMPVPDGVSDEDSTATARSYRRPLIA